MIHPSVPEAGEGEQLAIVHFKTVGLPGLALSLPLLEAVCGNQTALRFERLPERGSGGDRFGSGVDGLVSDARVFRPRRNESPSHHRKLPNGLTGVLADGQDGLRGSDVVAGTPLVFLRDCAEVLRNQLISPRQSVPSAHGDDYLKLASCAHVKANHRCIKIESTMVKRAVLVAVLLLQFPGLSARTQVAQRTESRKTSAPYTGDLSIFDSPERDERLQINRASILAYRSPRLHAFGCAEN